MHAKQKGNIGELAVGYDLTKNGYNVFTELGDLSKIDLIAEKDNKLYKIQVKASKLYQGTLYLRSDKSGPNYKHKYSVKEVDIFALYSLETGHIAYINAKWFLENQNNISIRILPSKNKQQCKINYQKDFSDFEEALRGHTSHISASKVGDEEMVQTTTQ